MIKKTSGQSLLELVTILGFSVVIITALVITNINGLKNSQFSKNQLQATKLAQEGINIVRSIRDQNGTVCNQTGNSGNDFKGLLNLNTTCTTAPCVFILNSSAGVCNSLPTTNYWLNFSSASGFESLSPATGLTFKRQVIISDPIPFIASQKEVIVQVSWDDISGTHKSNLSTVLSN